jgi:hypothetical protein
VAAIALSERLVAEGFAVTPRSIESWRSRGVLGRWQHVHHGGSGSVTVPAPDAAHRARVAARLAAKQRDMTTITLLALAIGGPVDVDDVRLAVAGVFAPVLIASATTTGAEPADRADAYLSRITSTRRGGDALRRRARELSDTPDPQRLPSGERSSAERAHDAYSAVLAAVSGDPTWIGQVLSDALRLGGMRDLVDVLESQDSLDDALTLDVEHTASTMIAGLARLDRLDTADIEAAQTIFAALDAIEPFAASTAAFVEPDVLVGLVANSLLSQLAFPGQLRDGLVGAWNHDAPDEA